MRPLGWTTLVTRDREEALSWLAQNYPPPPEAVIASKTKAAEPGTPTRPQAIPRWGDDARSVDLPRSGMKREPARIKDKEVRQKHRDREIGEIDEAENRELENGEQEPRTQPAPPAKT